MYLLAAVLPIPRTFVQHTTDVQDYKLVLQGQAMEDEFFVTLPQGVRETT